MMHLQPRNVMVGERRTTVRLERRYWEELQRISRKTGRSIRDICTSLDKTRQGTLASALRVFVLDHLTWIQQIQRPPLPGLEPLPLRASSGETSH